MELKSRGIKKLLVKYFNITSYEHKRNGNHKLDYFWQKK